MRARGGVSCLSKASTPLWRDELLYVMRTLPLHLLDAVSGEYDASLWHLTRRGLSSRETREVVRCSPV